MAMPAAADVKLWIVSATIWEKYDRVALAAVALPVGVGGEARGGVEGEVRCQAGEALRIERQAILVAQDEIGEQQPDEAEGQQGKRVADPALLLLRMDAADAVGEPLDGTDDPVEPGFAPDIEHLHQIKPEWLCDEQERDDIERELEPGSGVVHDQGQSRRLKFFRTEDGDDEVGERREGDETDDDIFHGGSWMRGRAGLSALSRRSGRRRR